MTIKRMAKCPKCGAECEVYNAPKMVFGQTLYPATCVYHGLFYRKIG